MPFLCFDCDSRVLGPWESQFASGFFRKHLTQGPAGVEYGPWLRKFCAVVCWRALAVMREEGGPPNFTLEQLELADRVLNVWHDLIVDQRPAPTPHDFHILPLNRGPSEEESRAAHFVGHFACRDSESGAAFVLVKLQDLIVVGSVHDPAHSTWEATQIQEKGIWGKGDGTFPVPNSLRNFFERTLNEGVEASKTSIEAIKAGPKAPRRPFRPRPDCKPPQMHYDRTGPALRLAIELGPVDDVWEDVYIAFSTKRADHGASLAIGPSEFGAWKATPLDATSTRIDEWNRQTFRFRPARRSI